MGLPRVNAVIVGAGAAGGIVAKALAEAGLAVILLERVTGQRSTDNADSADKESA